MHGQTFRIVAPHVLRDPALPRLPQSARRGRGVLALRAQVEEEVFVGDVVEYPLPEVRFGLRRARMIALCGRERAGVRAFTISRCAGG